MICPSCLPTPPSIQSSVLKPIKAEREVKAWARHDKPESRGKLWQEQKQRKHDFHFSVPFSSSSPTPLLLPSPSLLCSSSVRCLAVVFLRRLSCSCAMRLSVLCTRSGCMRSYLYEKCPLDVLISKTQVHTAHQNKAFWVLLLPVEAL